MIIDLALSLMLLAMSGPLFVFGSRNLVAMRNNSWLDARSGTELEERMRPLGIEVRKSRVLPVLSIAADPVQKE